jgi:uncharacterized protein HemX
MTEPLDFTAAGRKKNSTQTVPAPQMKTTSPKRLPTGKRSPKSGRKPSPSPRRPLARSQASTAQMVLAGVAVLVVAAIVGYFLFGRGGKKVAAPRVAQNSSSNAQMFARYCDLAKEFDGLAPLTASAGGTADTSVSTSSRILQEMGATIAEMRTDAPAAVRSDVAAMVAALQEAGNGNLSGIQSPSYLAQRQRISTFRQKTCNYGAGANEQ